MRISVAEASRRLLRGEVVAIPTETVYGLAAPLKNPSAIEHIFALKQRPTDNPLIIHLADASDLAQYTLPLPPGAESLVSAFWPGGMTIVVPIDATTIPSIARAGLSTAAFRIPNHPLARSLTRSVGALVAPSANLSGRPSSTAPEHVEQDFGIDFPVVDGGPCLQGLESTILIFLEGRWQIGRLGALPAEAFQKVLGYQPALLQVRSLAAPKIVCPGQQYRHYAPKATLILGREAYAGSPSTVIGFSDRTYKGAEQILILGPSTAPEIVSQNLYHVLRQLDEQRIEQAWVDSRIPESGIWKTIAERLARAASADGERYTQTT